MEQQANGGAFFTLEGVRPLMRDGRVTKYLTTISVGRLGELLDD